MPLIATIGKKILCSLHAAERATAMAYKTILVHLNDERRVEGILRPVISMARRFGSIVVGVHVLPGMASVPAIVVPYGAEVAAPILDSDRKAGEAIRAAFESRLAAEDIAAQWHQDEVLDADLCSTVLERGRAVDLIVAGQADPEWPLSSLLDFPEQLALEGGRPVLIIPNCGRFESLGQRPVIAWNGSREAARAVFDALPLFSPSAEVRVLSISGGGASTQGASAESVVAALRAHGLKAKAEHLPAGEESVDDVLVSRVADVGADLLVMGAYGRSRWREYVFGGVTRAVARHMTVPTLMSH
jgi:nucleotide-binding universal stress UspA family protein